MIFYFYFVKATNEPFKDLYQSCEKVALVKITNYKYIFNRISNNSSFSLNIKIDFDFKKLLDDTCKKLDKEQKNIFINSFKDLLLNFKESTDLMINIDFDKVKNIIKGYYRIIFESINLDETKIFMDNIINDLLLYEIWRKSQTNFIYRNKIKEFINFSVKNRIAIIKHFKPQKNVF
ncbi:hypothetical protein GVAV_001205 [Gurleya vavrai]